MDPAVGRRSIDLDGTWQFIPDPEGLLDPAALPVGEPIAVPGCWEARFGWSTRIVRAWYRRSIDIPADWTGSRAVLRFGAVMYLATVFVNGREAGRHEGGYLPFEVDITGHVRAGERAELAVQVVNPMNAIRRYPAWSAELAEADSAVPGYPATEIPHGKQSWYASQSGIWQSVRLEARSDVSVERLRVTPDVGAAAATVAWRLEGTAVQRSLELHASVVDPGGRVVSERRVATDGATSGDLRLDVPVPVLWDIGRPNLYRAEVRLLGGDGTELDRVAARFGMREIRTDAGRILLNGRPIYLLAALDQDLYADTISTPPSRAMLDDQIARARELGLNLLRCHIKVPDPAYLDAADEAGMLVWAELPNWGTFTAAAARRGRATLEAMVDELGNHPSIVIWTIINEDWGTRVREEARDRIWLAETYDWLKNLDPSRLVVDNSACDTDALPNFHVRTDLADFHVYHGAPDNAARWRNRMADFATRPAWLWSPHGDASPRGDEPLVLSEFGTWGLPRLDRLVGPDGRTPWWFDTGRNHLEPLGLAERFQTFGLDRIWPSVNELADATQEHQFEALQYEIGELRKHDSIQGYVVTELADAYWEANGLLDVHRGEKVFHDRFARVNSSDVVVADLARRDVWSGGRIDARIHLGSYGERVAGGQIAWRLVGRDGEAASGRLPIPEWPEGGAREVGALAIDVPASLQGDVSLEVRALDGDGRERARNDYRLAIVPQALRSTAHPRTIVVDDPLGVWQLADRVRALGHEIRRTSPGDGPLGRDAIIVSSALSPDVRDAAERGASALVLVRDRVAVPASAGVSRPVEVRARSLPDRTASDGRTPWDGDWVTAWSWLLPGTLPGLPDRNPLDFAYEEVLPDHVLAGYDPLVHRNEVVAGMFAGWVHAPVALIWSFPHGQGRLTLTTFRVAPEGGPVATVLLEGLIGLATGRSATAERPATAVETG